MKVHFLDGSEAARETLRGAVTTMLDAVTASDDRPAFPSLPPAQLRDAVAALDPIPDDGVPFPRVADEVSATILANGVRVTDPWCAAHLHAPTLLSAAATELAIGLTNQSMDSYDQAPAATYTEDHLLRSLADLVGLPPSTSSGVLTSGGTSSNLLGLLLARDRAAGGPNVTGLPAVASRWRVLASAEAHVSIRQACAVLGLGRDAVVPVDTDDVGRMRVDALDDALAVADQLGDVPIAIVGTAGTTDAGAIDPLADLAERAAAHNAWFHVDAAVGSALALSDRLRPMLRGLERADSVTADLHKLWWQPIGASALLVRDATTLHGVREPAAYLNRTDDTGVLNLVDRSLDTSRRFDALKVLVSLRATGRRRLAGFVEHLVDLAAQTGHLVDARPDLELVAPPQTVTVLFRCRPLAMNGGHDGLTDWSGDVAPVVGADTPANTPGGHPQAATSADELNIRVQRELLASGRAVVGRTRVHGHVALKLTLVNPLTTIDDVARLLDAIAATARRAGSAQPVATSSTATR